MTQSIQTEFLILGGGITNLAFAAALPGRDFVICEADSELGGYCKTVKQDGFVWDYSGHFFHFRHREIEEQLVSRIGADNVRKIQKDSRIHWDGGSIDFPFQKNIHQLPKADFIDCLAGLFERPESAPNNFKEMLYSKFGRGISERFLVPYNEKLYATDLARLDVGAMGRFFPYADVPDIIRGFREQNNSSYNSSFTYPEGGAIEYVKAIAQDVPASRIRLNERVLSIDLKAKRARTTTAEVSFDYLISAAPFPALLKLAEVPFDPAVYSYNKVLVFNLGFDKKGPKSVHWIYYPQRDLVFYRLGFYDNIFDTQRMSMYVEIGFPSDAELGAAQIAELKQRVLQDLRKVGIVDDHRLVSEHHVVLDPAYVHITQASLRDVEEKKAILATRGVYSAGRYGSWTYCSIEDNIVEARALAARFNALG
jgi:protoporphyrinogen oxidase